MPANFISALLAAGGNSRASRSARAKLQWRDRFGRFVEMGRGIKFKVRLNSGATVSVIGKFTGVAGGNPDYGSVYVSGDQNGLKDGFYEVKSSNGQEILATVTPEYLKGRGIEIGKDANGNPVGERVETDIPSQATIPFSETPEGWVPRKDGQPGFQTEDGDYSVTPNGTGFDLYADTTLESNQKDWAAAITRVDALDKGSVAAPDTTTPATPENAATPAPSAAATPGLDLTTGGVAQEGALVPVPGISERVAAADVSPESLAEFVDANRAEFSKGGKRLTIKFDSDGNADYGISDAVSKGDAVKLSAERNNANDVIDLTGDSSAQEPDNSDSDAGEPVGDDAGADPAVADPAAPEDDAEQPARVPGAPAPADTAPVDLESREYLQSRLTKLIETQKGVENPRAWDRLDKQIDEVTAKLDALDAAEPDAPETPEAAAPARTPEPSPEPDAEAPTPASDPAPEADAAPSNDITQEVVQKYDSEYGANVGFRYVVAENGNAKPSVMSPDELQAAVDAGAQPLFRVEGVGWNDNGEDEDEDIDPDSPSKRADKLRTSDTPPLKDGDFGFGIYFGDDYDEITENYGVGSGEDYFVGAALAPDARVIDFDELRKLGLARKAEKPTEADAPKPGSRDFLINAGLNNPYTFKDALGALASELGYDAIKAPQTNGSDYYVVLNRGKLLVSDTDVRESRGGVDAPAPEATPAPAQAPVPEPNPTEVAPSDSVETAPPVTEVKNESPEVEEPVEAETPAASPFNVGDTVNWRGAGDVLETGVVSAVRDDGTLDIDAAVGNRRANSKVRLKIDAVFAPGEETGHPLPPETPADASWVASPNGVPTQAEFDNAPEGAVVRNGFRNNESYFRAGKRWYRVEGNNEESNFVKVRDMKVVGPEPVAEAPAADLPTPEAIDAMLDEAFAPAAPAVDDTRTMTEARRQEIEANGEIIPDVEGGQIPDFDFSPPTAAEDPATDVRNRLDEARAQVEADQQALLDSEPDDVAVEATPEVQLEESPEGIKLIPEAADPTGMRDTMADYADAAFPPTQEQLDIINAVLEGKNVAVQALAGTGKTSTLEIIANRIKAKFGQKSRVLYIAFNTSVRNEAALRMPDNVESRTGDSLAWRATAKSLKDKLGNPKALFRNRDIALQFNIRDVGELPEEDVARELRKAISKYVISDADTITADHFAETELPFDAQTEAWANAMWADLNDPKGVLPFSFEHATKRWALSRPDLSKKGSGVERSADVIFFDEAQDINPVMAKVVRDQNIQKVYVGDGRQAIYGFRGAENELDKVETDVVLPLTKSWRFGPEVAGMGNRFLSLLKSPFKIIGGGQKGEVLRAGSMTDADAVLTRTNSGAIKAILEELERGRTVGVRKKYKKELTQLVDTAAFLKGFGKKPSSPHADLNGYSTWDEIEQDVEKGKATRKVETLFKLVDRYGTDQLRDALERVVAMPEAGESNGAPAGAPDGGYAPITVEDGATGELFPGVNYSVVRTPAGGFVMSLSGKATFMNRDMLKAAGFWKWNGEAKSWSAPETKDPERLKSLAEGARPEGAAGSPATVEVAPDVIVSTAHQAKGAEWDNVRIADDFWGPRTEIDPATGETFTEYPAPEELRLAYVAVTRAKKVLDPGALAWVLDHTDDEDEDPEVESKGLPGDEPAADVAPTPEVTPEPEPAPEVAPEPAVAPTPEVIPEPTPTPEPAVAPEAAPDEPEDDGLPNTIEELEDLAEALDIRAAKGGAAGRIAQRNLDKVVAKIEAIEEANNAPAADVVPEPVAAPEVVAVPMPDPAGLSDDDIMDEIDDIAVNMNLDRMAGEPEDNPRLVERQNELIDEQNRRFTEKARAVPASDKLVFAIEQASQGKDLDENAAAALAEARDDEDLTTDRAMEILDEIQIQANAANTASKPREFVPETYTNGNRALLNPEPFDDLEPNLILRDLKDNHPGYSTLTNGDIVIFSREFGDRTYEVVVRRNAREHFQTYIRETDKATGIARIRKDPREVHSYAALSKRLTARKLELSGANPLKWMNTRKGNLVLPAEANGMLDADALDGLIRGTDLPESKSELLNQAMGILADMIIDGEAPRNVLDIVAADRGFAPTLVDTIIASTVRRKIADEAREKFRNRPSHMSYDGKTILKEGDVVEWTDWRKTKDTYGMVFRGFIRTVQYNSDPGKPYKYSDGVRAVFPEYNRLKGAEKPNSQDRQFTTANLRPVTDPAAPLAPPFFAKKEELAARRKQFSAADFGLPANGENAKSIPRPAAARVPKPEEAEVQVDIDGQAYIGPDDAPIAVPFDRIDAAKKFAGLKRVDVRAAKIQVGDMIIGMDFAGAPAPAQVVEVLPWSDGSVRIVTLVQGDFGGAIKKTLEIPAGGPAPTVYRADMPGAPIQPESSAPKAWEDRPANAMQYGIIRDLRAQKKLSAASAKVVERALANMDLTQGQAAALVGELVNHKDAKKTPVSMSDEIAEIAGVFDQAGARAYAEQMIAQNGRDLSEFGDYIVNEIAFDKITDDDLGGNFKLPNYVPSEEIEAGDLLTLDSGSGIYYAQVLDSDNYRAKVRYITDGTGAGPINGSIDKLILNWHNTKAIRRPSTLHPPENYFRPDIQMAGELAAIPGLVPREDNPGSVGEYDARALKMREQWYAGEGVQILGGNGNIITEGAMNKGAWFVKTDDGTELFQKFVKTQEEVHKEVLSSRIAYQLGLTDVIVAGDTRYKRVIMTRVVGELAAKTPGLQNRVDNSPGNFPNARLIGLLDYLIGNPDRHGYNWMQDTKRQVIPIDHGNTNFNSDYSTSPFVRGALGRLVSSNPSTARPAFTEAELIGYRQRLRALRVDFEASGQLGWHDSVMTKIDRLIANY